MYIRRIMVRNFRKFTSPCEIKDISDGITVIAGDNEEGKSTLLNAIRSAIFERHNVSGKPLDAMLPFGDKVRVETQLDFELDKKSYHLEKNFGHKSAAILKRADGSVVEGHTAEDELGKLLTFRVASRGKSKHDDRGFLGFFWLEQGHNLEKLDLGEVGRGELRASLEKEVGDVMGGSLGRKIMKEAKEKCNELLTSTGKPRKDSQFHKAEEEANNIAEEVDNLSKKEAEYHQDIKELGRIKQDLLHIDSGDNLEKAQQELDKAKDKKRQVEALQQDSKDVASEIKQAEAELEIANNRWKQRQNLINEVKGHKDRVEAIEKELNKHTHVDFDSIIREAENSLKSATQTKKETDLQYSLSKICQLKQEVDRLDKQINKISEVNKQLLEAQKIRDSAKINRHSFDNLEKMSGRIQRLQDKISSVATRVCFFPTENQAVTSSKANILPQEQVEVGAKECFTLDGFGKVEIEPVAEGLFDKQQQLSDERIKLDDALAKAGVKDMNEAESCFNSYQQAEEKVKEAEIRIKAYPDSLDVLQNSCSKKKLELKNFQADVGEVEITEVIDTRTAEQRIKVVEEEVENARTALSEVQQSKHKQEEHLRKHEGKLQEVTSILESKEQELEDARANNSDEKLVAEINSQKTQIDDKKKTKEEIDARISAANPDDISLRIKKAEDTIYFTKKRKRRLEDKKIEIVGRLQVTGAEGIGEKLDAVRGAVKRAEANLKRVQLEADSWKLLVDTLTDAEREAKEMFVEPVLKHILPFLNMLFPQSKLTLDEENMEIKELHRDGKEEPFISLSIGTREQLSILVRLALAVYLKEKGYPSMVILDDALVYADDGRFERIQLALRKAAESVQVIILTCRSRDWVQAGFPIHNLSDAVMT